MDTGRIATRAAVMIGEAEADGRHVTGWRVSSDIHDELAKQVSIYVTGEDVPEWLRRPWLTGGPDRLLGAPLVMDPALPPNSIIASSR